MTAAQQTDVEFEAFLAYLSTSRNFDFTAYKRGSLRRRVDRRMQMVNAASYSDYTDYLEVHPEEFTELFNTILINVTSFFRDTPAWDFLSTNVIPQILERKRSNEAIRVWSAGCASGEEPYSLAIILAEALGESDFRQRVKIYATDVDEDALNTARQATYTARELNAVPDYLREKYFEPSNGRFAFRKDLRRAVIFGRHDLLNDAPISRVDLLVCRNTLMYFNTEGQGRVISRFLFGLNNGGFLFLGKAETLFAHTSALLPVDLKLRVFARPTRPTARDRIGAMLQGDGAQAAPLDINHTRMLNLGFEMDPTAQMIVDANGAITAINERARTLFGLTPADVGRPLQDLEISYRPADLRSLIDEAYTERRAVTLREVEWLGSGSQRWLDVSVLHLPDTSNGAAYGVKVLFTDVTRFKELQQQLQRSKNELETAYEELQSTNEELETTNEELQSTIEELETTNEELQSTNEELETMNEELQSTNEELETVNTEIRDRGTELTTLNAFLESMLASMRSAVVVVNQDLAVTAWNSRAVDLWGLRADEVRGKHLLNLDIGLPLNELRQPIRDCLAASDADEKKELLLKATNRRGRAIHCRVTCAPLTSTDGTITGVIMQMEDADAAAG